MNTGYTPPTLTLPKHWTPEQAELVFDFLHKLAEAVWNQYEGPLMERLYDEINLPQDTQQDLFDDDLQPF